MRYLVFAARILRVLVSASLYGVIYGMIILPIFVFGIVADLIKGLLFISLSVPISVVHYMVGTHASRYLMQWLKQWSRCVFWQEFKDRIENAYALFVVPDIIQRREEVKRAESLVWTQTDKQAFMDRITDGMPEVWANGWREHIRTNLRTTDD